MNFAVLKKGIKKYSIKGENKINPNNNKKTERKEKIRNKIYKFRKGIKILEIIKEIKKSNTTRRNNKNKKIITLSLEERKKELKIRDLQNTFLFLVIRKNKKHKEKIKRPLLKEK